MVNLKSWYYSPQKIYRKSSAAPGLLLSTVPATLIYRCAGWVEGWFAGIWQGMVKCYGRALFNIELNMEQLCNNHFESLIKSKYNVNFDANNYINYIDFKMIAHLITFSLKFADLLLLLLRYPNEERIIKELWNYSKSAKVTNS